MNGEVPAVSLTGAVRNYGPDRIIDNVSLRIDQGRFVVLRGGNGTGKTTLLRVIATRLKLSAGQGSVFGFDLSRQAHEVRRRTALVSVLGGAYAMLSAEENLKLAASLYGLEVDAAALLGQVGLGSTGSKLVRSFSSGMKKRLALARLLLPGSQLWLLDEPYSTLDDDGRELVDRLVGDALQRGVTVLMATHGGLPEGAPRPDAELLLSDGRLSLDSRGTAR